MEAARWSETLTQIGRSTRRNITEDNNLHSQRRDILQYRGLVWRVEINSMGSSSSGETYSRLACIESSDL